MVKMPFPAWTLLWVPLVVGAVIMLECGAPVARWAMHLGAGTLGVAAYFAIVAIPARVLRRVSMMIIIAGVAALASTLLGSDIEGMHRWHQLGALRIHFSALLAPLILVLVGECIVARPRFGHVVMVAVQVVHVLQPDAGQATAFGAGAIALTAASDARGSRTGLALAYAGSIVVAWMRPDPLPPAPFVEDIVVRAFQLAPPAGAAALLSIVLFVFAPGVTASQSARFLDGPTVALVVYFACSLVAAAIGEFPVPLLGFGPSPIVGAFAGLAALRRLRTLRLARHGSDPGMSRNVDQSSRTNLLRTRSSSTAQLSDELDGHAPSLRSVACLRVIA